MPKTKKILKENSSKELTSLRRQIQDMKSKLGDLASLIEVSQIINSTLELDNLLNTIMEIAKDVMHAEASSLMLLDENTNELVFKVALGEKGREVKEKFRLKVGQGICGWVAQNEKPAVVADAEKDPRHFSGADETTGFRTKSVIAVPLKAKTKTIGVLEAMNPLNKPCFEESDVEIFSAFASQAAVAIENARLHKAMLEKQKVEQELIIARSIQQSFLPSKMPHLDRVSYGAVNEPAQSIGGDLYDVFVLSDTKLGVTIGDVAGKGIPAALFMVKGMSDFRFHVTETATCSNVLNKLNRGLENNPLGIFITMLYCIVDTQEMILEYTNAGHCEPLIIKGKDKSILTLGGAKNLPIGVMPEREYTHEKISISPGDTVFLYTDGVIEARNKKSEQFGIERLCKALQKSDRYPQGLVEEVRNAVNKFAHGLPQHDDLTAVAVRID